MRSSRRIPIRQDGLTRTGKYGLACLLWGERSCERLACCLRAFAFEPPPHQSVYVIGIGPLPCCLPNLVQQVLLARRGHCHQPFPMARSKR